MPPGFFYFNTTLTFIVMKTHFILRLALVALVGFMCNVAKAAHGHDPTGVCYVADDASKISAPSFEPTESFVFIQHDFIMPDIMVLREPDVSYVDRYILNLPNHNLLPTRNIWLLGHAIRLC